MTTLSPFDEMLELILRRFEVGLTEAEFDRLGALMRRFGWNNAGRTES